METLAVLSSEHERMAEYTLAYSSGETATLLLSLQNGEVTEFMLTMRRPMPPAPLTADANWFLQQEHDAQQAQYEESLAWIYQVFWHMRLHLTGKKRSLIPRLHRWPLQRVQHLKMAKRVLRSMANSGLLRERFLPQGRKTRETCARPHSARNHERVFLRISSNTIERSHNPLYNLGKVVHIYGKTRTSVVLAGQEFKLTGTESEEYIKQLSDYVNGKINEIQRTYPNLSTGNCVLLASLNMADELHKLRADYDALDQRIAQLRDMPRVAAPVSPVKRPFESRQPVGTK